MAWKSKGCIVAFVAISAILLGVTVSVVSLLLSFSNAHKNDIRSNSAQGKVSFISPASDGATEAALTTLTRTTPPHGEEEPERNIYFATKGGGIKAYSTLKSQVKTIVSSKESCYGITYSPVQKKIYWSTWDERKIYQMNGDGSQVKVVFITYLYGAFQGLALDWITGNLYVGTEDGFILVCNPSAAPHSVTCLPLILGQHDVEGITLHPVHGEMYWTRASWSGSSIWRADMDGSRPSRIVTELGQPRGILIDFQVSRLYWADFGTNKIQSSNLDGRDMRVILHDWISPFGIAHIGDKIFWGTHLDKRLESMTRAGTDIRTQHTDAYPVRHLTVVPDHQLPTNRTNDCSGRNCWGICVLTSHSYRCLN